MLTISQLLTRNAKYRPDHLALVFNELRFTYAELNASVNQLCHALRAVGVGKGTKVATLLPNCAELYQIYWACAKIGAVCVPNSPLLRGAGLVNLLNDAHTQVLITNSGLMPYLNEVRAALHVAEYWLTDTPAEGWKHYHELTSMQPTTEPPTEQIDPADPYNIMYSSGTTGLPKGIVISHQVRALYASLFASFFRMTPESVVMHSGSIVFNGSFLTLMPLMFVGGTYVLLDHFDPRAVVEVIARERVTHTILVPSQIVACLQLDDFEHTQLSSLEYILSVGAPLLLEHKQSLNRRVPGVFYELYGLTEGFMTILDKTEAQLKTGSVGAVPQFMDIKIVDDNGHDLPSGQIGEIVGRSPLLMSGYYNNPEKTAEAIHDGWLYTGDVGYLDSDGYLFLTGRKKDLIISGGVNVYPVDIEEVVARHPAVQDVAVFGVPHPEWGETPVAAVVLRANAQATATDIRHFANSHLDARYQKLSDVVIVNEFPKNVAGKILKRELKEGYQP